MNYSKFEHEKFVELWNANMSVQEIATYFNISADRVRHYAMEHRNECPSKKCGRQSKIEHEKFVRLWNEGKSIQEIAEAMPMNVNSVGTYACRHRSDCPYRQNRDEEKETVEPIVPSVNEQNTLCKEKSTYDTIILDTSSIHGINVFELIKNAKHVVISSVVLRELNNLKDRTNVNTTKHKQIQKVLRECALDINDEKYSIVDLLKKASECPDETIARCASSIKDAVVVTCDYGLCCFCKLYKVKYLLLENSNLEDIETLTVSENLNKNTNDHEFKLIKSSGKLTIICLKGTIKVTHNDSHKTLNPEQSVELFEGDSVMTKFKEECYYEVKRSKRNKKKLVLVPIGK